VRQARVKRGAHDGARDPASLPSAPMVAAGTRLACVLLLALATLFSPACRRTPSLDLPSNPTPAVADHAPDTGAPPARTDFTAGPLRADHAVFTFAVFYLPTPRVDPLAMVRSLPEAKSFTILTEIPKGAPDGPAVAVLSPPLDQYAPPSADSLRYANRGLEDAQQKALLATAQVTLLTFRIGGATMDALHASALRLVGALAKRAGGLPWDEVTRQVFSLEAWQKRIDAFENGVPIVPKHVEIDAYRDGELLRLVTRGMQKLGLPDVAVNQVVSHDAKSMGSLINLLCQALAERPTLDQAGGIDLAFDAIKSPAVRASIQLQDKARRKVHLNLAVGEREEGDADNRLIEIVFPGQADGLQERQNAVLTSMFGAHDEVQRVEHDPELLAASARARAKLLALKPVWSKNPPELERLVVKGPFRMPSGGNEWMWVEVTSWEGTTLHGVLDNDPDQVEGLRAGSRVAVEESSVFDYIHEKADGGVEGNETAKLLMAQ
jgi:uncharacterized protein YegJ (DUF2314 family)